MNIRTFTNADYDSIVEIRNGLNIVWPAWPRDPAAWREIDRNRDPKCAFQRWVAEEDGKVVGAASRGRRLDDYHPQKFYINIEVPAACRNHGIGTALYDRLMEDIQPFEPRVLRTDILENQIQSYPFMQKRGFKEVWRETPVHLDVAGFDPTPYAGIEAKLHTEGITITSMHALEGDPQRDRKAYELYIALCRDVPSEYEEFTVFPYEDWVKMCLQDPSNDLDAFFIVTQGDRYIALHELGPDSQGKELLGSLMGTLPEFRGRQIGLALMVRAITFAKERNLPVFKTCTAVTNKPMQSIFNRLGFGRDPEWLQCQKDIEG